MIGGGSSPGGHHDRSGERGSERRGGSGAALAALGALWLVASGLNLLKPFHMDDTAHLLIARNILTDPLRPMSGMLNWLDTAEPVFVTNQPHLFFYMIAGTGALFGWSELPMHLLTAAFALAAILAFHAIARRHVPRHALLLSALFVLGPGVLVNQNVMTDIPLLAFMALAFLALSAPDGRRGAGPLGFAAYSAALLTKYTALFLFPALLWLAAMRRGRLVWALLPLAALALWSAFNLLDYGAVHILNRPSNEGGLVPSPKLAFSLVVNLGLFALPLTLLMMLNGRGRAGWLALFALGLGLYYLAIYGFLDYPHERLEAANAVLFAAGFVAGCAALVRLGRLAGAFWRAGGRRAGWARDNAAELGLGLWLAGGALFLSTFPPFMASRHALLLAPPLLILAARAAPLRPAPAVTGLVLAAWAGVGLFLFAADLSFARFWRDQAPVAAAMARELAPGARLYARGHWGWQWYARQAGLVEYDSRRSRLASGDILVDPVGISAQALAEPAAFETIATIRERPSLAGRLDMQRFYAAALSSAPVLALATPREIRILRRK